MSGGHLFCADRSGAETDSPWSHYGWVCLAARLLWSSGPCLATTGAERRPADCKSVTQKHRRFESCPIHFRLRVRVVCGASPFHSGRRRADVPRTSCDLLRWCAATHRRFKSFRKRSQLKYIIVNKVVKKDRWEPVLNHCIYFLYR